MISYGHIDEFCPEDESVEAYLERIDIYFRANDTADEKKVSIFLRVLAGKMYSVLKRSPSTCQASRKNF